MIRFAAVGATKAAGALVVALASLLGGCWWRWEEFGPLPEADGDADQDADAEPDGARDADEGADADADPDVDAVPTEGLLHHWPFEGSGADLAGDAPMTIHPGAAFGAGVVGRALLLDDGSGEVEHAESAETSFNPTATSWTLSLWMAPSRLGPLPDAPGGPVVFGQRDLDSDPVHSRAWVYVDGADDSIRTNHNGATDRSSGVAARVGAWTHVVLRFTRDPEAPGGGVLTWFVDGLERATHESASVDDTVGTFAVGAFKSSTGAPRNPFEGLVDEVRLYGRPLSVEEIVALFEAERP